MMSSEERGDHPKSGGRVKLNIGGTIFETTISTLTRLDNTMLSTMVADRWQNQEELFVDLSPTHFGKILDYLRDGGNMVLPADLEARESLRKEAEFYNLPELAKLCLPGLHVNDWVQWKEKPVEAYWAFCGRYECNRQKSMRWEPDICKICGSKVETSVLLRSDYLTNPRDFEELFVKHESNS